MQKAACLQNNSASSRGNVSPSHPVFFRVGGFDLECDLLDYPAMETKHINTLIYGSLKRRLFYCGIDEFLCKLWKYSSINLVSVVRNLLQYINSILNKSHLEI